MVDMSLRMSARMGHRSSVRTLQLATENDPPPPGEPVQPVPFLKSVANSIPTLGEREYGHVYVVGFADYVKIGWSENVAGRLFDINKHAPEPILIYKLIPAYDSQTERLLHDRFKLMRLKGEWFGLASSLKAWIRTGCPTTPEVLARY